MAASVLEIIEELRGNPASGHQRKQLTEEIDQLLRRVFDLLRRDHGEERAALQLFEIVAADPHYRHPRWMRRLWREYRAELLEEFTGSGREYVYPNHNIYEEQEN